MAGQNSYMVFPSYNMVAQGDKFLSEPKLRAWSKAGGAPDHISNTERNGFTLHWSSGAIATIDTGVAYINGLRIDSLAEYTPSITFTLAVNNALPITNHVWLYYKVDDTGNAEEANVMVLIGNETMPDNTYHGMEIYQVVTNMTTVTTITDVRIMDRFDGSVGHEHTGSLNDAPLIGVSGISCRAGVGTLGLVELNHIPADPNNPVAIDAGLIGVPNGIAGLDDNGQIAVGNVPYLGANGINLLYSTQFIGWSLTENTLPGWQIIASIDTFELNALQRGAVGYIQLTGSLVDGVKLKIQEATGNSYPMSMFTYTAVPALPGDFSSMQQLAVELNQLSYIANATFDPTTNTITILAAGTSFAYGDAIQVTQVGTAFLLTSPSGGGGVQTFLMHDESTSTTTIGTGIPGTVVINADTLQLEGNNIIIGGAAEIPFTTMVKTLTASSLVPLQTQFVFATGTNSHCYMKSFKPATGWSDWVDLGGLLSDAPSWSVDEGPVVDIYGRGTDKKAYHKQLNADTLAVTVQWESLGGALEY